MPFFYYKKGDMSADAVAWRATISQRARHALAIKKAQGFKLGGLNAKGLQNHDNAMERANQLRPIFTELEGRSACAIAKILNKRKIATPTGGKWHTTTVLRVQKRILYRPVRPVIPERLPIIHHQRTTIRAPKNIGDYDELKIKRLVRMTKDIGNLVRATNKLLKDGEAAHV